VGVGISAVEFRDTGFLDPVCSILKEQPPGTLSN
jgi:hypothetical protein